MKLSLFLFIWLASSLPMASFAYAEELDEFFQDSKPKGFGSLNNNQSTSSAPASRLKQVKRLDQEILILRAEMSKKNGDAKQVRQYVNQLEKQYILPAFKGRVEQLKRYVASLPKSSLFSFLPFQKNIHFPMHESNSVVAIVLPTSGPYELVGLKLQKAIQDGLTASGFQGKLIALDSDIYDTAFEMWEVLKFYEPSFIFGPLRKDTITSWQKLDTGVPTMYFNEV